MEAAGRFVLYKLYRFTLLWNHRPAIFIGLADMSLACEIVNDVGISTVVSDRSSNGLMRKSVLFADPAVPNAFT
jgi:hypothetical protein